MGENVAKAQTKQKRWYDKGARLREFQKGDLVLVLLPTSSSKLLAQWQGPYQVVERAGKVIYKVDMFDKRKRYRVFHVNMLKAFQVRLHEQMEAMTEEIAKEIDKEMKSFSGMTISRGHQPSESSSPSSKGRSSNGS